MEKGEVPVVVKESKPVEAEDEFDDVDTKSTASTQAPSSVDEDEQPHRYPSLIRPAEVLFVMGVVASLSSIFVAYGRSWDDMQEDPDWSISRILAYDYNLLICYLGVLPSYLIMISTYTFKHYRRKHVRYAAGVGGLGGLLAFTLDVEGFPIWHGFAAFLLLSAVFTLRKDANKWQSIVCSIGFVFAIASCVFRLIFRHYAFGLTMAFGEFLILVPWAFMMFNTSERRET